MTRRPDLNDINKNKGLMDIGSLSGKSPVAAFNLDGIENLITTKGFLCYHYKHALNPNRDMISAPVNPNEQVSFRGFRYYDPRPVYHVPRQYTLDDQLTAQAVYQKGSVLMNLNSKYEDNQPEKTNKAHFRQRDIIIFPSLTDMTEQVFEYNPTGDQQLHYKAKAVDYLFDTDRDYRLDIDFSVTEDGYIKWLKGGQKPSFKDGKGAVLSITYYYTPIYIISHMLHSLRVLPSNNTGHAAQPREATYAPQQLVCIPSSVVQEKSILDWSALPPLPDWRDGNNITGGSV